MPIARVNGVSLFYEDVGQGPPALFIHAFPVGRGMWEPQVTFFDRYLRVITYDCRGFGRSEAPTQPTGYSQALSVDGALTGYENLLIFAKLYDIPRAERTSRIDAALALMGLSDAANKLVREYSGGMIRRLEIAQSTLHRPSVIFLDEPTVGLDPVARKAVRLASRTGARGESSRSAKNSRNARCTAVVTSRWRA